MNTIQYIFFLDYLGFLGFFLNPVTVRLQKSIVKRNKTQ